MDATTTKRHDTLRTFIVAIIINGRQEVIEAAPDMP